MYRDPYNSAFHGGGLIERRHRSLPAQLSQIMVMIDGTIDEWCGGVPGRADICATIAIDHGRRE
jgi:hypothetical protein